MVKSFMLLIGCALYITTAAQELLRGTLVRSGDTRREALSPRSRTFLGEVDEVSVIMYIVLNSFFY